VVTSGLVPYDDLVARYARAHVAVDLMKYNRERELAFTTRTVVYLWCGLPVIYNNYSELSDYISAYNAGWTLDPEDEPAILAALQQIFDDPAAVAERSRNAQRLAQEQLAWDKTIDPIDNFLQNPAIRPHEASSEPLLVSNLKYLAGEAWFHYKRAVSKVSGPRPVPF
jgi:glycosyltransferase involved in cell wall biosynthesis